MRFKNIYEDNHIIVVTKPPGMLSQKDQTKDITLTDEIKSYLVKKYNKPGNAYLGLVHRLDRPVGGLMVLAKTSKAASRLSDQIRRKAIEKKYYCVVKKGLKSSKGTFVDYLYKNHKKNQVYVVNRKHKNAKKAVLKYKVISKNGKYSLVEIDLITGRAHQIRVQFSNRGFPIVGDRKYGNDFSHYTVALWAGYLSFMHPVKKEKMIFFKKPENKGVFKGFGELVYEN